MSQIKVFDDLTGQSIKCQIQCDYQGNVFIKNNNDYYTLSINHDSDVSVGLCKITNPELFRKNLKNNYHLSKNIKSGEIRSGKNTLRGKACESLDAMTDEEKEDYSVYNNHTSYDNNFKENKFFWVKYDKNEDKYEDGNEDEEEAQIYDEENDGFYLNGVITCTGTDTKDTNTREGIVVSDILLCYPGTYNTLLIVGNMESKKVVSYIERIDGYCTSRMTIYTEGIIQTNAVDSTNKYCNLHLMDGVLIARKLKCTQ